MRCSSCKGPLIRTVSLVWRAGLVELVPVQPYCFYGTEVTCPARNRVQA